MAEQFAEGGDEAPDWSDREAVIAYYTDGERAFAGTIPVDEEWVRRVVGRAWDRSPALASAQNHWRTPQPAQPGGCRSSNRVYRSTRCAAYSATGREVRAAIELFDYDVEPSRHKRAAASGR
ncbi:hypothetical protein [Embleya sp. NPDC005575]|uniref:hypothetical protein n=1 Tax=Embleya sp. NPDC005575 TaxID=3156892 RepID=UPI0033BBDE33